MENVIYAVNPVVIPLIKQPELARKLRTAAWEHAENIARKHLAELGMECCPRLIAASKAFIALRKKNFQKFKKLYDYFLSHTPPVKPNKTKHHKFRQKRIQQISKRV